MKLLMENWRKYLTEMGVGAFTGGKLQLFIPRTCPDEECSIQKFQDIKPVKNGNTAANKPWGGVWTSTANLADSSSPNETDEEKQNPLSSKKIWTSGWNEWMKYEMPNWMNRQGILLKPTTSNIFHIENEKDLEELATEFPLKGEGSSFGFFRGSSPIDYEKAFETYDAIHFGTTGGQSAYPDPGAWDVESTCWKDLSVLKIIGTVSVNFEKPSWD